MKISVIVTVYNRPEMLIACLRALALSSPPVDEVVVSDDGSRDEAARKMQAAFAGLPFPVRYVWQADQGYRLAAARNNGIRQATGDYLLSLDCDILLLPDAVAAHLRRARRGMFLAANRALADAEATNGMLGLPLSSRSLEALWFGADRGHLARVHRQFVRNLWLRRLGLAPRHKPKILGCHFSLFREDLERVNGFDEQFVGWGLEDDDFALRLHQAGVRGASIIPEARAVHLWHPAVILHTLRIEDNPNKIYFRRRNIPAYCVKGLAQSS